MLAIAQCEYFLASAATDTAAADALYRALLTRGLRTFHGDLSLQPGDLRDELLAGMHRTSAVTVVLISTRAADDYELRETLELAIRRVREPNSTHELALVFFDGGHPLRPLDPLRGVRTLDRDILGTWDAIADTLARWRREAEPPSVQTQTPDRRLIDDLLRPRAETEVSPPADLETLVTEALAHPGPSPIRVSRLATAFESALRRHPPTARRLLYVLSTETEVDPVSDARLATGCTTAWRQNPLSDDPDAWTSWACWAVRCPEIALGLDCDPLERARTTLPRGDNAWGARWRRLWAASPGHSGLTMDAGQWLYSRRRPPGIWVAVWEDLLAGLAHDGDRALLLLAGARWLREHREHGAWPTLWRSLVAEPKTLLPGLDRRSILRFGLGWLDGHAHREGWGRVWATLFEAAGSDAPYLDRPALAARGRAWLERDLNHSEWTRVWHAVFEHRGPNDTVLADLAVEWLLAHEDDEGWARVWQTLLNTSTPGPDRGRLVSWGRTWLTGRERMGTWTAVVDQLLDAGIRDVPFLETVSAWIAKHPERREFAVASKLLRVASARCPCDEVAAWLAAWLEVHADQTTVDEVQRLLAQLAWDGLDRSRWGPGWRAVLAREGERRSAEDSIWSVISAACEEDRVMVGKAVEVVKGGLTVDLGVPAFMPASQIDRGVIHDREPFLGVKLECRIVRLDRAAGRLVVSRTAVLDERRAHLLDTLKPGEWMNGAIKSVETYGAFVDLGGLDGLIHVREMTWDHPGKPADYVTCGQAVRVRVLEIDRKKEHVSLSLRDPARDPWLHVPARYRPGQWVEGTVRHITHYGAFIELAPGVEGMVHISELSWDQRPVPPQRVLKLGAPCRARVIAIDLSRRRLAFSMLDPQENPWVRFAQKHPKGARVNGVISQVVGEHVMLRLEPEPVTGLMAAGTLTAPRVGQAVDAFVEHVDPANRRVSLRP